MSSDENGSKFPITSIEAFWIVILTTIQTAFYIVWRFANNVELNEVGINSGSVIPLFTLVSTFIVQTREIVMFLRDKIIAYRKKLAAEAKAEGKAEGRAEGRVEGKAERDSEWIEWATNGKDPDKMPSKINPVKTSADNKAESNVSSV